MPITAHLISRFLHIAAAILWVGNLGALAGVILPAARTKGEHAPNLGPILTRLRYTLWLGPLTVLLGAWLITASGHSWSELTSPPWGHAILGGIGIAVVMMGLEGGLVVRSMRKAHTAPAEERDEHLDLAWTGAVAATFLGLVAAFLMVAAPLGGFV